MMKKETDVVNTHEKKNFSFETGWSFPESGCFGFLNSGWSC